MSLPSDVSTALGNLTNAFAAATPLASAGNVAVTALQAQAASLVSLIDAEIVENAPAIDGFTEPAFASQVPGAVLTLVQNLKEQNDLGELRGLIGRVASNLDQVIT